GRRAPLLGGATRARDSGSLGAALAPVRAGVLFFMKTQSAVIAWSLGALVVASTPRLLAAESDGDDDSGEQDDAPKGPKLVVVAEAADEDAIAAALEKLLPPVYGAKKKKESTGVLLPRGAVGSLAPAEKPPDSALPPREAWEARGGFRPQFGALLLASATVL